MLLYFAHYHLVSLYPQQSPPCCPWLVIILKVGNFTLKFPNFQISWLLFNHQKTMQHWAHIPPWQSLVSGWEIGEAPLFSVFTSLPPSFIQMTCQDSEGIWVRGTFTGVMHILSANVRDVFVKGSSVFKSKLSSIFSFVERLETVLGMWKDTSTLPTSSPEQWLFGPWMGSWTEAE